MFSRFGSLRFQIVFLILLAMLPAVVLTIYVDLEERELAILEAESDILATLRLIVAEERQEAEATQQILTALAHHPRLVGRDLTKCSETLLELLPEYPHYRNMGVLDSEGNLLCSAITPADSFIPVKNASFQSALETRKFTIGDFEFDPTTRQSTVMCNYPILDRMGQVGCVMFARFDLDWFYEMAARGRLQDVSILTLIDGGNMVMARYPDPNGWVGKTLPEDKVIETILTRGEGVVEALDIDGIRRLHAFMPLSGRQQRGFLILEIPLRTVIATANERLARNLIILGLVILVALTVAKLFGRVFIVRKMAALVSGAQKLASGDLSARSGLSGGKGEFSQLGHAFDEMAETLERHEIESKAAEEALRTSEENFRNLVENSLTGICIIKDGRVVFTNPEQERLTGQPFERETIINFGVIHPEDEKKVRAIYEDLISGRVDVGDLTFRVSCPSRDDKEEGIRWLHCRASCIQYQGEQSILVNMTDITELKELEYLAGMQDKMTSLGRVAAGIVHELRNPLSAINIHLANLERLQNNEVAPGYESSMHKAKAIVEQLKAASRRIDSVIRRVTDFSKPGQHRFVPVDVNQCIEAAVKFCATSLRKSGIEVEMSLAQDLPKFHGDPFSIEQVLINLIGNSKDIMRNGNKPRIALSTCAAMSSIIIKVCDSGPGVPLHFRGKIFDPFFSTQKDTMGIGLSISQRIVSDHGGSIKVSDSKWGGAEFTIEIPRADRSER